MNFQVSHVLELMAPNGQVLLQVGYFISSRAEQLPGFILNLKITTKSLALLVEPKLLHNSEPKAD